MAHSSPQTFMWLGKPPSPLTPTPLHLPPLQTQILRLTPLSLSQTAWPWPAQLGALRILPLTSLQAPVGLSTQTGVSLTHSPPFSPLPNLHLLYSLSLIIFGFPHSGGRWSLEFSFVFLLITIILIIYVKTIGNSQFCFLLHVLHPVIHFGPTVDPLYILTRPKVNFLMASLPVKSQKRPLSNRLRAMWRLNSLLPVALISVLGWCCSRCVCWAFAGCHGSVRWESWGAGKLAVGKWEQDDRTLPSVDSDPEGRWKKFTSSL